MVIEVGELGDILAVRCGNMVGGKVPYWTTLYCYKNLLIDTGCAHTAGEVKEFFKGRIPPISASLKWVEF